MKIVVIGGTGLIGTQLCKKLQQTGNEVIAASPNTGVNTLTGAGLDEALKNAQVVVDVSNAPSFEATAVMNFFKTSNENLLAAEKRASVSHHIALSVAGTQHLQESGYFRAKQAQEDLIKTSGIPYTIVHATQFFEFAGGIVQMSASDGKVVLPDALIQPVASADVAEYLALIAQATPANSTLEIGGPEKFDMSDWIRQYAGATGKQFIITKDPNATYSGAHIKAGTLVTNNAAYLGKIKYGNWIAEPANQR